MTRLPNLTLEPTKRARAVPTLALAPKSSYMPFRLAVASDVSASPTFGHRYRAISFIIAQSAFLCSLFESVCSESNASVFGVSSGLAFFASW